MKKSLLFTSVSLAAAIASLAITFGFKANAATLDDYPSFSPKSIRDGVLIFVYQSKYGFADIDGNIIAPPDFDYLQGYHDGKAFGIRNGIPGFISKSGQFQELPFLQPIAAQAKRLEFNKDYNFFTVTNTTGVGIIDTTGKWIVTPKYKAILISPPLHI